MNIHKLTKLSLLLKREFNKKLAPFNLTFNQWLILKELKTQGPIPAKELGEAIGSDKATVSQCINLLEKKGYITRVPNEEDRRVKLIEIDPSAKIMCQEIHTLESEYDKELCALASKHDLQYVDEAISKVYDDLSK